MPPQVLFRIPMATDSIRLIVGGVCLFFVLAIYGFWLPRGLRILQAKTTKRDAVVMIVFFLPILLGLAPLGVLVALIVNPAVSVTETGVTAESAFHRKTSLAWSEIDHVVCFSYKGRGIRLMQIVASNGKNIEIGNSSGVDLDAVRDAMLNHLGPEPMRPCPKFRP
jgi:hypothetical protein